MAHDLLMCRGMNAQLRVREVMNAPSRWCRPHDSLAVAANVMLDQQIDFLPVLGDGDRVVGVLGSRDLWTAAATRRRRLDEIAVEGVMHTDVHACQPDDDVDHALFAMQNYRVPQLPVVGLDGELVGLVSLGDLARRAAQGLLGPLEVVRAIAAIGEARSAIEKV